MRLQYIGRPKTWRDADTGNLVSDLDSIHRTDALEGDFDEFGADYDDFDEFGDESDEDFGDDDTSDDDDSDDDDSDEDFGDDDEDFGATRGQRRRRSRRSRRRTRRQSRRSKRRGGRSKGKAKVPSQKTILSGSQTSASAGAVTITITPGHKFKAHDIVFNGSSSSATVTSITFGDNLIWNNADGIDVSVLSTSSYIRGLVKGAKASPGVPITINGTIASGGDTLKCAIFGTKPGKVC